MTDYLNRAQAKQCLLDNKLRYMGQDQSIRNQIDQYIDGYSEICAFLSRPLEFQNKLAEVSKKLWFAYRNDPSESNKFTRALSVIGSQLGFSVRQDYLATVQNGTVTDSSPIKFKLTGNDTGLGFFLRNKLFWKDSMEALHGEHSHSLQWLAIAVANLGTALPVSQLYSQAGSFVMSGTDGGADTNIYLWAWLADCFPQSMKKFGDTKVLNGNKDNLTTDSYRSPQNITTYLVPLDNPIEGHFVSTYLFYRYTKRKWIKGNIGGSIGGIANAKASTSAAWSRSPTQQNRFIRTDFSDVHKNRVGAQFEFHGIPGNLYNL
jgi:hypothetical protein